MSAWRNLEKPEYDAVWDRFYEMFKFNPSVRSSDWPGIVEPAESITFSIGHVYDRDPDAYDRRTLDLCVKLIRAFRHCVPPGETIFVLDLQHACYIFEPHSEFDFTSEDEWPVPALPNGDYYIFLTRDMRSGVFGHPWEQTMCVFGRKLIERFAEDPPELFTKTMRVGGHTV
jgi:hypothetical protein